MRIPRGAQDDDLAPSFSLSDADGRKGAEIDDEGELEREDRLLLE